MGTNSAAAQLYRAWEESELTLEQLLEKLVKRGLKMSAVSLSRKLRGLQVLDTEECAVIADVLHTTVTIGRRRKAA